MRSRRALGWAAVALLLSLGLARLHDYRGWDQSFYLAQTSSLAEDGDVDPRNDLLHLQREPGTLVRALTNLEPNGSVSNTFAIGASLLWLPPYALAMPLGGPAGAPATRWDRPQLVALQLFALAVMVWLLWVGDRWLRRMGATRWLAALGAAALVLGTPLVIYGFRAYMGSHQASAVAVMLLVLATLRLADRGTPGAAWLWGVALGLVFLCRWQDLVKGIVVLVPILELRRRGLSAGRWAALAAAAAAGALLLAGVQLEAWLLERGRVFGLPQGPSYIDPFDPELGRFLFSGLSGLLPWSPLFAVGLAGLLLPWRSRLPAAWRWAALAVLLFDVYLNATVDDWWGGASYGARRMTSDLPLLALGLGNLACWRRLRWPLAAALAACCLWGAVTANLRLHGLRDLSILVRGEPSAAPGAEREDAAQPSRAEAIRVATSWPLRPGKMTYFARRWAPGRALTVAIGAVVCLLAAWLLGRPRAPDRLGAVLLAVAALAVFAHARLLLGPRGDPEERREWGRLGRVAAGRVEGGPAAALEAAVAARDDRFGDARRLLLVASARRAGDRDRALRLLAGLDRYPFTAELRRALSLAPGVRSLISRRGFFHEIKPSRPENRTTLARRIDPGCTALRLTVRIEAGRDRAEHSGRLLHLGRRGEPPLAVVELRPPDAIVLRTARASREAGLGGAAADAYRLDLEWRPRAGTVGLAVVAAAGEIARLEAPAVPAAAATGRMEVATGAAPAAGPAWGRRFSDLDLTAWNVCREP